MTQQTKQGSLPLKVHSRVRVVSVLIQARFSPSLRDKLLKHLNATGIVTQFDPRYTLPFRIKFDDGSFVSFAEDNLEVLAPKEITA